MPVIVSCKERNIQIFRNLLNTAFVLTLIPKDPRNYHSPIAVRAYGTQVINKALPRSIPQQNHQVNGPTWCYFPGFCHIIRMDILSNWQNLHIGALNCGVKSICSGKGRNAGVMIPIISYLIHQCDPCKNYIDQDI